jgi:hypothetical protein
MFTAAVFYASLALTVRAALGPVTDLPIVNADIAPDGFTRSSANLTF